MSHFGSTYTTSTEAWKEKYFSNLNQKVSKQRKKETKWKEHGGAVQKGMSRLGNADSSTGEDKLPERDLVAPGYNLF